MTTTFKIMPAVSLWGDVKPVQLYFKIICNNYSWNKRSDLLHLNCRFFFPDERIVGISLLNMLLELRILTNIYSMLYKSVILMLLGRKTSYALNSARALLSS